MLPTITGHIKDYRTAYQGPSSTNGGTQRNGDHCFLRGGGMIQVDVGGHLPIPFWPPQLSLSVSLIVAQFTVFSSFSGLELPKPFWGPTQRFLRNMGETWVHGPMLFFKSCISQIDLSNELWFMSNEDRTPKLWPQEVDVPIYQNRAHSLAFHLLGLGFWMFRVYHCFSTINSSSSLIVIEFRGM